jgi:hypothetical protein
MAKPVAQTPNPTENSRRPFANLPRLMNCWTAVVCDKDEAARVTLFDAIDCFRAVAHRARDGSCKAAAPSAHNRLIAIAPPNTHYDGAVLENRNVCGAEKVAESDRAHLAPGQ